MAQIRERKERLKRLELIKQQGIDPYPPAGRRSHQIKEILTGFKDLESAQKNLFIVGRIKSVRKHGGSQFIDLEDGTARIQVYLKKDVIGDDQYEFLSLTDIGDFIEVEGGLFKTKAGELTVQAKKFRLLSKALLPLPEKWHGLKDIEERYRKRYLDLIMNPEVKERFVIRSKIVESIRRLLLNKGYLEVETPVLQTIYGGGFAKPFITHHNALDIPLYLRISDELYLKRLLVGHFEKIFEFCRDFRNEGLDPSHNPEFTMLEAMTAYQDYRFSMDLVEEIYETAAKEVLGTTKINYQEHQIDLKRPWKRLTLHQAVKEFTGHDLVKVSDLSEAIEIAAGLKIDKRKIKPLQSVGEITNLIFEEKVESNLIQPVIIYDYPVEVSPLAKKSRTNPKVVERFEHFIFGKEHGNHYSELNDPVELKKRFIEEKNKKEAGFEEAHQTDLDFVEALEHGMPPATGIGIGIDRLAMLFTNSRSIKEVIFFPTMKPKTKSIEENGKAK